MAVKKIPFTPDVFYAFYECSRIIGRPIDINDNGRCVQFYGATMIILDDARVGVVLYSKLLNFGDMNELVHYLQPLESVSIEITDEEVDDPTN